jgi:hypothetical protein
MKCYTQTFWELISNLLSFNITHVKRELNSMADMLVVFVASPNRKLLPQIPDCTFQYLYRPHIPDNVESWQVFPSDDFPKNVKIGAQCYDEEKLKFIDLLGEFQDVFAWSYEDLHGFYPALIQHTIPIKEGIKPVRKKQIPINPALEATIRKELEKLLKVGIIFPVKYYEWVSNLVPIQKTIG